MVFHHTPIYTLKGIKVISSRTLKYEDTNSRKKIIFLRIASQCISLQSKGIPRNSKSSRPQILCFRICCNRQTLQLTATYCQPLLTRTKSACSCMIYANVPSGLVVPSYGDKKKYLILFCNNSNVMKNVMIATACRSIF